MCISDFTRHVHKVSFPGAVYRNKTLFIGTDTASVELFFNIFTSGIEMFVIPWDQILYPVSWKNAAWDWNHCDTYLRLSVIPKTLTLNGK